MDRTRHLTKDTYVRADIINLSTTDYIATTVVVTFKHIGMTDGGPLSTPVIARQNVLKDDVVLLSEIETARVTAIVHIVSKFQQFTTFNLERLESCSITFGEDSMIGLPQPVEVIISLNYLDFIIDLIIFAPAIISVIPLNDITFSVSNPQNIKWRNNNSNFTMIGVI